MSKVIISKRVLFVCEYNTVVGVMVRCVVLLIDFLMMDHSGSG